MGAPFAQSAAVYHPPLPSQEKARRTEGKAPYAGETLPQTILLNNVRWFCMLRWIVVGILLLYGCTRFFGDVLRLASIQPPGLWPFVLALLLAAGNAGFLVHASHLEEKPDIARAGAASLWVQILFDLLVLTAVVYFLGGSETFFPFAYLFHIGLACVFFPRSWSFLVTLLACLMFSLSVILEETGILPASSIYMGALHTGEHSGIVAGVNLISAQLIWVVVWYLMSHLAALVRARDAELARANRRLLEAQQERARHMLQTTHELKAPFAAIHANTQLLLKGHCGRLSDEALDVVLRISARARRLAREIQDMLQLANLNAGSQKPFVPAGLNLGRLLDRCLEQVRPLAEEKDVHVDTDIPADDIRVTGVEDHLKMMFDNLLTNAVTYSRKKGVVRLACGTVGHSGATVTIEDDGIGIPPDKLPRIFDEYYRTNEAVRHCRESTGLGLAIVKRVADSHEIQIRVESEIEKGTRFKLIFPRQ